MVANRAKQHIILVTGKGGVGKTTVAAGLALALSNKGYPTLLAELGERSSLGHFFQRDVQQSPQAISSTLSLVRWEGEACLREYLRHLFRVDRLVDLFFDNRVTKALVHAAPALRELAILGKVTSGLRHVGPAMDYQFVVVDAFATGHFRALLNAPKGLADVVAFGPLGEQTRAINALLRDPTQCSQVLVTLPEELPVAETLELDHEMRMQFSQNPKLVVNRMLQPPLSHTELQQLHQTEVNKNSEVKEFIEYLESILDRQERCCQRLRERGLGYMTVPMFLHHDPVARMRATASCMESQWKV